MAIRQGREAEVFEVGDPADLVLMAPLAPEHALP
jgi:hypothetical protein